jgi:hypothetical protein
VPIIAFSTDANGAARGAYLLSFLPETEVIRIVDFAIARGKRSFAALLRADADELVRLCRRRWCVPLPSRRHQ